MARSQPTRRGDEKSGGNREPGENEKLGMPRLGKNEKSKRIYTGRSSWRAA